MSANPNAVVVVDRHRELLDPPDMEGFRNMARVIIARMVRDWRPGQQNQYLRNWFLGDDYRWWANVANIGITGNQIVKELETRKDRVNITTIIGD